MTLLVILLISLAGFLLFVSESPNSGNCLQPPAPSQQIFSLASAIALAEGSNPEWNNPGDLTISFGYPTIGVANSAGVLKFHSCEDGWNALYKQLSAIVNGTSRYSLDTSLAMFGVGYSGGDQNWAINVARALGVSTETTLGEILI
jgi:hypothetical protein